MLCADWHRWPCYLSKERTSACSLRNSVESRFWDSSETCHDTSSEVTGWPRSVPAATSQKKKRHSLARWNSAVGVGSHGCSYARLSFQQFNCTPSIHNWECWFIAPPKSTGIFTSRQVISHNNEKGYTLHSKEVFHWDITMLSRGNLI